MVKLGLHPRYPGTRTTWDHIVRGGGVHRRVFRHYSLLPFSIPLPPFPMCRAFPGSKYYGGSAPSRPDRQSTCPAQAPGPDARRIGGTEMVPVFTVIRSTKEEPDSAPAASPRLPRSISPWSPGRPSYPAQELPTNARWVRTAPGPYPPDSSRCTMKGRKRRFLAYSFPSRSPDPHHLAVLARPGFVRAASHPHRRHPDRAAPSSTVPLRQDQRRRSFTSVRFNSASRRTGRSLRTMTRVPAGQPARSTRPVASATQAPSRIRRRRRRPGPARTPGPSRSRRASPR